jgi:hypothetical protein
MEAYIHGSGCYTRIVFQNAILYVEKDL